MEKFRITNCHVHLFTTAHVPRHFPHPVVVVFRWMPWLIEAIAWIAAQMPWERLADKLDRLRSLHATGQRESQADVFRELGHFYPADTRFIVLPMDMAPAGYGPVERDIREQHDELAALAAEQRHKGRILPFATLHPDRVGAVAEFKRCIETHGFRGLKLYPKLGYAPDHPLLMREVYPYCVERGLPVISHCSRGGVYRKGWSQADCDRVSAPDAFLPVLKAFPGLRVDLAHFGGDEDWWRYLAHGFDPDDPEARQGNWLARITEIMDTPEGDNLYTDISYTIFRFADYAPLLKLLLGNETLRPRILFGSDFYMTRQEELSEKSVSIRLREMLGEADFRQIAETNPVAFLGEVAPVVVKAVAVSARKKAVKPSAKPARNLRK